MNKKKALKRVNYYFITDETSETPMVEQVRTAVEKGVKMIQYRKKTGSDLEKHKEVKIIKKICGKDSLLIINDRVDIALIGEADGVHLGQDDLPVEEVRELSDDLLIGVSTHELNEALEVQDTVDYVAVGPIHKTTTKQDTADELGIQRAKEIARSVNVPTAAIGGVEVADIPSLVEDFDMICAISKVTRKGDLNKNIEIFENKIDEVKSGYHE